MSTSTTDPVNRHALTAVERQRSQLEKLLKDPAKPAYIPPPPKEKTIRPAREMMKNVQGSSAGAGSGEFHVYKASRRREYERLKLLDEVSQKEEEQAEFERRKRIAEEQAEAKTAKNRAKRQKKKEKAKVKGSTENGQTTSDGKEAPIKKRRLVSGKELVFRRPGEDSGEEDTEDEAGPEPGRATADGTSDSPPESLQVQVLDAPRITIHEDD